MSIVAEKEIAQHRITAEAINYIYNKVGGLTKTQIENELRQALGIALANTVRKVIAWIERYVPEATGNLKDHLIETTMNSPGMERIQARSTGKVSSMPKKVALRVGLSQDNPVPYAKYVNAMSDSQVRHTGMVRHGPRGGIYGDVAYVARHGMRGKIILNDPQAVGGYAGLLRMYAREQFKDQLKKAYAATITFDRRTIRGAGI